MVLRGSELFTLSEVEGQFRHNDAARSVVFASRMGSRDAFHCAGPPAASSHRSPHGSATCGCPNAPGVFLHLLCLLNLLCFSFDAASALCQYPDRLEILRAEGNRISFRISILASGSMGNATLLETERTTLLIDAGLGKKEMLRRFEALGRARPDRVDAILITHEHSDHSSSAAQMAREFDCPAYLTEPTHREIVKMYADDPEKPGRKAKMERVEYIRAGERFEIGDIEINPFAIPHDAADPVGYAFRTNGTKVAIVTDLGYLPELVKHHLREADFLILESNHDLDMLKVGPYPWYIKQRVMSRTGHLSNNVVSEFLADSEVFDGRARHLVLAHLSEQNNTPDIAQICAEQALASRPVDFCFRGSLHIASQRTPLGPFEL